MVIIATEGAMDAGLRVTVERGTVLGLFAVIWESEEESKGGEVSRVGSVVVIGSATDAGDLSPNRSAF